MTIMVDKDLYWTKLVDYYYDEIHWNKDPKQLQPFGNVGNWLKKEYNANVMDEMNKITFNDQEKFTWFMLQWA